MKHINLISFKLSKIDRRYVYLAWIVAVMAMLAVGAGAPCDFGDRAAIFTLR